MNSPKSDQTAFYLDSEVNTMKPGMEAGDFPTEITRNPTEQTVLDADHPLMIKYQNDLKQKLSSLLLETDEHLLELKRTITSQENENRHFAQKGHELQKQLMLQEEKLKAIDDKCKKQQELKESLKAKCDKVKEEFKIVEGTWQNNIKLDSELQQSLEDVALEVVQLTSLQAESEFDAKTLKTAVEKTVKDRENLELQKLRQDLLISRLENDKFNLEDKINLYKMQWGIKKEEASDLRKALIDANSEIETIHQEKQQLVHHWKQSIASLEKQDHILNEIRNSAKKFEDDTGALDMDIASIKKTLRKELERNEHLTFQLQLRESDVARVQKDLKDVLNRQKDYEQSISVLEKTVEITEQELKFLTEDTKLKEKDIETRDRELQRFYTEQKSLERQHMDVLHEKMTITKASSYTDKLIKDTRNAIRSFEEKGAMKENEKQKLLLKLENLHSYVKGLEKRLSELEKERGEQEATLNKSEASVLKTRDKMDTKRNELKVLENQLQEMIDQAGGEELAPFERELASIKKEITIAEQGKRSMEQEYLRFQQELFSLSKQATLKSEEIDFFHKKIAVLEGKKMQLEADIEKEEKEIKDVQSRIRFIRNELARVNKILSEKNEAQENLLQTSFTSKSDYLKVLKEYELDYIQKKNELRMLERKKKKHFRKLIEAQRLIVYWEGRVRLAEETRKMLKSKSHTGGFAELQSEIRRLQVRQEHIRREREGLVQEMERAVYRYTSLYVEADKQALFGKRRKTPEYVQQRIKHAQKKIRDDKKELESSKKQIEALFQSECELSDTSEAEKAQASEIMDKIRSLEYDLYNKEQEKRQSVIKLSLKQKKSKFLQKVLDGTYIRAIRNEANRAQELEKLQSGLRSIQIITQAANKEHPDLEKTLNNILDYIFVSKQI